MNFDDFKTIDFEPLDKETAGFLYIACWMKGDQPIPFYVGQTRRL